MDKISQLSDDLLFKILSFIPIRDAMSTGLLSKRWKIVWKLMPTLDFDEDFCPNTGSLRFDDFCRMFLQSYEARVVTSLNLKLRTHSKDIDRILRNIQSILLEMTITSSSHPYNCSPIRLPRSLYVNQTLVVMKLQDNILVDVFCPGCFRSLKSLHLTRVNYSGKESFSTLLSACPVLEDLFIERVRYDGMDWFTISVPSLLRLYVCEDSFLLDTIHLTPRFQINAPSLKYLTVSDHQGCFRFAEDMPKLVEAHVEANNIETKKLLRFLTSAERLSIHICSSTDFHLTDINFHRLLYVELHLHNRFLGNLILSFLKNSPKLQALKIIQKPLRSIRNQSVLKPSSVPECLTFHLKILEWRGYAGRPAEKEIAAYILENAQCLNTANISRYFSLGRYRFRQRQERDVRIVKELLSISKASTSCQLVIQVQR